MAPCRRSRIGRVNAAVLPVPVWAAARTSRPCEHERDGPFLDGRGLRVALLRDGPQEDRARAPALRMSSCVVFLRVTVPPGRRADVFRGVVSSGVAPSRSCEAAANRRTGRSIRDNAAHGHPGHARDRRGAARGHRVRLHEYAHDARASSTRAVAAMHSRRSRRSAWIPTACTRRSSSRSTGGSASRSSRPDAEVDLKAVAAGALGGRKASIAAGGGRGAGDGLRAGRDLAARDPARPADGRSTRPRRVADDPCLGRPARPGDRAGAAADLVRLTTAVVAPIARR